MVLVKGYFAHQRLPDLYTSDGNSFVPGSEAASLAGPATPGEFAQLVVGSPEGRIKVADSSERVPQPESRVERPKGDGNALDVIAAVADGALDQLSDGEVLLEGGESIPLESIQGAPVEDRLALGPGVSGEFAVVAGEIFQQALYEGTSLAEAEFRVQQAIREVLGEVVPTERDTLAFRDSIDAWSGQEGITLEGEGLLAYEQAVKDWFRFSGEYEYTPIDIDFKIDSFPLPDLAVLVGYTPELEAEPEYSRTDDFVPLIPTLVDFNYEENQNFEVPESAGTVSFTITRGGRIDLATTVDFATSDGTATAGSDYTATSGKLTFAPGETAKEVRVNILDDAFDESDDYR
jgi:hypothetical protein